MILCYHQIMKKTTVIQGRKTTNSDIELVQNLIADNPGWNRTRLSRELCRLWDWRNLRGQIKDMACRSFLLKLEQRGQITLPVRQTPGGGAFRKKITEVEHQNDPITCELKNIAPVTVKPVNHSNLKLFDYLLARYHYLGFRATVGQNMKYMVFDKNGHLLACLLFGSAAWACAPRDHYIGWSHQDREANINMVTNNMRFLILPWVTVPHLASHILGQIARRINLDWVEKYGHQVYLLETFIEKGRFLGTCYRAANWVCVGQTKGRSRNDRYTTLKVPVKDIYLYSLKKRFREVLSHGV